jgi:pimeloyl-ACP methyl ester carboxylesterase
MLLALVLLLALPPALGHAAQILPDKTYLTAQRLVPLADGRRLNLFCLGHAGPGRSGPTVLLDSGHGESMVVWHAVQGAVARFARVCAYDRAGFGFSDPPRRRPDALAAVHDIHALLAAAGIKTPVLYVGHSVSGLYGVLLQALYPGDVAGEVLVDPAFAGQSQAMMATLPPAVRAGAVAMYKARLQHMRDCATMAAPLPKSCLEGEAGPARLGPKLAAFQQEQIASPGYQKTNAEEYAAILPGDDDSANQKIMAAHPTGFGDKPLIVLTHSGMSYPGATPAQTVEIEKAWNLGHDRLAALSTRGSNTVVPGSGHYIQLDQPQAVIAAIRRALGQLRGGPQ